jgi:hypothetical protein
MCRTPSGRTAARPHTSRLARGRHELGREEAWQELERRGAAVAVVPFSGRAGVRGSTGTITLSRLDDGELVDVERWTGGRDELCYALEQPIWDRFGGFAGQPRVHGTVTWILAERSVVIEGRRGDSAFEETSIDRARPIGRARIPNRA